MNKKSFLIQCAISFGWFPVTDQSKTFIQTPCPSCERQMMVFQKTHLGKERIFQCTCGYKLKADEAEYEDLTGRCFVCGKRNCCGKDHRFIGTIPAGMGL
jgi:hypothetical protein